MIIENIQQNSPEWVKARTGIPTSSNFNKIITTGGKSSKQREKYMYQLAAEKVTGIKDETYKNSIMERGLEMESEARAMYEILTGNTVEEVGICFSDKKKLWGSSPDGLVGEEGLVEIKCPSAPVHVEYLLQGKLPKDYFSQIMGQLFVTGRKWCDFFSFYPNLRPFLLRVEPDEFFIKMLRIELEVFAKELDEVTQKIRRA